MAVGYKVGHCSLVYHTQRCKDDKVLSGSRNEAKRETPIKKETLYNCKQPLVAIICECLQISFEHHFLQIDWTVLNIIGHGIGSGS